MMIRVYQNLRRHDWSMLDPRTGLVVGHRTALVLLDVTFIVSERVRRRVLAQQRRVNEAADTLDRPRLDMLNPMEHARILDLIDADTWSRGWTGREPLATAPFDESEGEADPRQARLFEDREDETDGDTLGLEEV